MVCQPTIITYKGSFILHHIIYIVVFIFYSVILTMAVYSDERVISGEKVAALINDNKETFNVAVSDAIVGRLSS